jgi:hypothetical protein
MPRDDREPFGEQRPRIRLIGNEDAAQSYIPLANKLLGQLQSSLAENANANLGQGLDHSFELDDGTKIDVRLQPGITNRLAQIDITVPTGVRVEGEVEVPSRQDCPLPPFGRPGQRLFTQLYGPDDADADQSPWTRIDATERQFQFEIPDLPIVNDGRYYRYVANLVDPETGEGLGMQLFGKEVTTVWISDRGTVGFAGPRWANVNGPDFVDSPCTRGVGDGYINYDTGSFKGTANFGNEDLYNYVTGNAGSLSELTDFSQIPAPRVFFGVINDRVVDSNGELAEVERLAVVFQFPSNRTFRPSFEIVYLGEAAGCPPYLGWFYGGSDGANPIGDAEGDWPMNDGLGGWCGVVSLFDLTSDRYTTTWVCEEIQSACNEFFAFAPPETNFMMVGAGNKALAYGAFRGSQTGFLGYATPVMAGRTFWIELTADGFPNGGSIVQAPRERQSAGDAFDGGNEIEFG